MKKYFLGILSFLLIGVYSAFPSFATGTNFDDISDISALSENHAQFIGNTGTTARSFTSISFFVSGLTSYPNTSGASGLNIFCYSKI